MGDIIYADISYKIIGILYDVFNEVGFGHKEMYYQNAIKVAFTNNKIKFQEQVPVSLKYKDSKIGQFYLDFLIDDKIVLEIKKDNVFKKVNIDQVYSYLKTTNLKLGILANFTRNGVKVKRIVNIK